MPLILPFSPWTLTWVRVAWPLVKSEGPVKPQGSLTNLDIWNFVGTKTSGMWMTTWNVFMQRLVPRWRISCLTLHTSAMSHWHRKVGQTYFPFSGCGDDAYLHHAVLFTLCIRVIRVICISQFRNVDLEGRCWHWPTQTLDRAWPDDGHWTKQHQTSGPS